MACRLSRDWFYQVNGVVGSIRTGARGGSGIDRVRNNFRKTELELGQCLGTTFDYCSDRAMNVAPSP